MTSVRININTRVTLEADLVIPENALALVIFSHGSGSSRFSPRNNFVAQQLQRKGIATLLADLLTKQEDQLYSNRFDIPLLSERLVTITNWVLKNRETLTLPIGYFGASTGAASALTAALQMPEHIKAIVSRGGRPDLAPIDFSQLKTPTLFLVGELDSEVLSLNKKVIEELSVEKELITITNATHLFDEPGTLEQVATFAAEWFLHYLPKYETNNLHYHSPIPQ